MDAQHKRTTQMRNANTVKLRPSKPQPQTEAIQNPTHKPYAPPGILN